MSDNTKEALDKLIDDSTDSMADFGAAITRMVQALQDVATAIGEAVRAAAETLSEEWAAMATQFSLETRAILWAGNTHPEWLTIYNRAKKRRIRKKYRDRIMRAYMEATKNE